MSKINLETLKKLLSVKKGGAEFFRLIIKMFFWVISVGAVISIIFSLNEIQNTEKIKLNIEVERFRVEVAKIERQCEATVRANLDVVVKKTEKDEKKKVTDKEKETFLNNGYAQCLFLNGLNVPQKNTKEEKKK